MKTMTIAFKKLGEGVLFSDIVKTFIDNTKENKNVINIYMNTSVPFIRLHVKKCISKATINRWLIQFKVNINAYYRSSDIYRAIIGNKRFYIDKIDCVNTRDSDMALILVDKYNEVQLIFDDTNRDEDTSVIMDNLNFDLKDNKAKHKEKPKYVFSVKKSKEVTEKRRAEREGMKVIFNNKEAKNILEKRGERKVYMNKKFDIITTSDDIFEVGMVFPKKVRDIREAIGEINSKFAECKVDNTNAIVKTLSSRYDSLAVLLYIMAYIKKNVSIIPADVYVVIRAYEREKGVFELSAETQTDILTLAVSRVKELFKAHNMSPLDTLGYLLFDAPNPLMVLMGRVFSNEEFDRIIEEATKE